MMDNASNEVVQYIANGHGDSGTFTYEIGRDNDDTIEYDNDDDCEKSHKGYKA